MKNWSPGYEIIRHYVRFALWLTHKRIVVTGRHLIPKGKPIIFAANHQNALMDSLAVACTNPKQSVWLARADIFKSKTARSILNYLKLIPVYRIRDGKDNLSNNEQVFARVTQLLEMRETVALFPEAAHSGRRQMLPHKKAVPRIALEAENKNNFGLGLQIVPVGIYYSHYWAFNRTVIVQYGNPIEVDKYEEEYTQNPQRATLSLRDEIHERLAPLTMQINSIPHYQDYENIRKIAGKTYSKIRQFSKNSIVQQFYAENELIKKLEELESGKPDSFKNLIDKTREYFSALADKKLNDKQIIASGNAYWPGFLVRFSLAVISLPIFIAGFLSNSLPFFVPRNMIRKKVKDMAFMSTFNFATGLIIFPLFYLLLASLLLVLTGSVAICVITFIALPFTGKIAYQLWVFYQVLFIEAAFLAGSKSRRKMINQLLKQRNDLFQVVFDKVNF